MGKTFRLLFILTIFLAFGCNNPDSDANASDKKMNFIPEDTNFINTAIRRISSREMPNPDSALLELQMLRELSGKINYQKGIGESFFHEGVLQYQENEYKAALESFSRAKKIAEDLNDVLLTARCIERMASVTLSTGDDHQALKLYYVSLPLFEQIENKEGIAKVYNIIGLYKSAQKAYDSSEMYYRRAIRLNEEINNQTGIVHNKGNLGYMFEKMGDFENAAKLYSESVDILINSGDSLNLPVIYYNISSLYEKQNQFDSTLKYLRLSKGISEIKKDTSLLSALYGDYGKIMMRLNYPDSSCYFLEKSIRCAQSIGDLNNEIRSREVLLRLDILRGNYKLAISRLMQMLTLKDSIYARKSRNNLKTSELRYLNQKKENKILLQDAQLKAIHKQKQIYILLFVFSLLTGALLAAVIFLIVQNNKKKRKLLHEKLGIKEMLLENAEKAKELDKLRIWKAEEEIRVKEQEQISHALALEQKNELLGMINNRIVDAMRDTGFIKISELNGIVASIKAQLVDATESDLFNQKFSQLHKSFYCNHYRVTS